MDDKPRHTAETVHHDRCPYCMGTGGPVNVIVGVKPPAKAK